MTEERVRAAVREVGTFLCKDRRRVYTLQQLLRRFERRLGEYPIKAALWRLIDANIIEARNYDWDKLRGLVRRWGQ